MPQFLLASEILRYYVETPDQILGDLVRLYFNSKHWKISFLGIAEGGQLVKKHILIPTSFVEKVDVSSRRIFVNGDFHQNHEVPLEEKDLPENEHDCKDLHGFKIAFDQPRPVSQAAEKVIGRERDIRFNRETWLIEGLIIQTHRFPLSESILISPKQIHQLSWREKQISIFLTRRADLSKAG